MKTAEVLLIVAVSVSVYAQTARPQTDQPAANQNSKQVKSLYQQPQSSRPYQPREDFFHASTKLINKKDVDYGAWIEERRRALIDASLTNPFFWYSALTTGLVMLLMLMYGVRVLDERRKFWRAAEVLTDLWNQDQYSRALTAAAVEKYNAHMSDCNRVIEAQISGRPSATALEAGDFKAQLQVVSAQRDAFESEARSLKADLQKKEATLSEMSGRLDALERRSETNGAVSLPSDGEANRRLVARVNELQQQLEAEQRKNRQLKGA